MRDIKFRAWHIKDKEMLGHKDACLIPLFTTSFRYRNGETILMQYTGCKDSKGADIYEGDIVYIAGFGVAAAEIHREDGVVFNDYNCNYRQFIDAHVENDIGHIVGNIHQTPELLNGDNNG